jgi:hypothetical protein
MPSARAPMTNCVARIVWLPKIPFSGTGVKGLCFAHDPAMVLTELDSAVAADAGDAAAKAVSDTQTATEKPTALGARCSHGPLDGFEPPPASESSAAAP